ncbi:MAG: branched-chain amino acid ABC transporter substrate-binding protein [Actinomycetota bacterium]|nr:branched-chain amino acid ABC transporter substrate-binding protein [Actinomycetota bacterium]
MKKARRVTTLVMAGLLAALVMVGCGGASGGGDSGGGGGGSIKIVSDLPLQGANRAQTTTMVNAIELAIEERDGEVAGLKVDYESLDDATAQAGQWDPAKCAENAQKAAQDEAVVGWIGPFNSGCAATQIPTLNEAGLAMVSPANTYIGLTKPGGEPDEPDKYYPTGERNYARVIVADDKQGQAGAALLQEEEVESVYILDDKETYGKGLADQFQKAAEEQGIEVIGREGIDGSASNYRSLMSKVAQAEPDAVYFGGIIENNAAQIIKDKVGAGMPNDEVLFVGPDGIFVDELLGQAGDAANGIYVTFGGLPESELSAEGQEFVETYEGKYDDEIQPYTAYAYEAANVMLDAIERAADEAGGVPERQAVIDEVFATEDFEGVLGTWSFDEEGDTSLTELSVQTVDGGEFTLDRVVDVADF